MLRRLTANIATAPVPVRFGMGYAAVLWLFSLSAILLGAHPSSVPVPLHYSYRFGVDVTGPWYGLYAIPFIGGVLLLVTGWLLERGETARRPVAYFLTVSVMLTETILLIDCIHFVGLASG